MTMKRIMLVLMVALGVGACGESSTDVVTRSGGGDGGFIPPDTVIKTESVRSDLYQPGHPGAVGCAEGLAGNPSFHRAVETAETFGYGFDPARAAVAEGNLADGREVRIVLAAMAGGARAGHVLYLRVGDEERSLPLRVNVDGDAPEILETISKEGVGPSGMWVDLGDTLQCLMQALADLYVCRSSCTDCWRECTFQALMRLVWCLHFVEI
jgi:hypothetical protein